MSTDSSTLATTDTTTDALAISPNLHFIQRGTGVVVLASELSTALGYQPDGIVHLARREWSAAMVEGTHFEVIRGADLSALRHEVTRQLAASAATGATPMANPVATKSRAALVLTEAGADLACALSRTPAAVELRTRIASMLPSIRRGEPVAPKVVPAEIAAVQPTTDAPAAMAPPAAVTYGDRASALVALAGIVGIPADIRDRAARAALDMILGTGSSGPAPVAALPAATQPANDEIPAAWVTASIIASRATVALQRVVSPQDVGRTISDLGVKARGATVALCRSEERMIDGRPRECAIWRYCPSVVSEVVDYLRGKRELVTASKSKVAKGAADVLAAIAQSELPFATMARPGRRGSK